MGLQTAFIAGEEGNCPCEEWRWPLCKCKVCPFCLGLEMFVADAFVLSKGVYVPC